MYEITLENDPLARVAERQAHVIIDARVVKPHAVDGARELDPDGLRLGTRAEVEQRVRERVIRAPRLRVVTRAPDPGGAAEVDAGELVRQDLQLREHVQIVEAVRRGAKIEGREE